MYQSNDDNLPVSGDNVHKITPYLEIIMTKLRKMYRKFGIRFINIRVVPQ